MEISAGELTGTNQKSCHHCLLLRPMGLQGQGPKVCACTGTGTYRWSPGVNMQGHTQSSHHTHTPAQNTTHHAAGALDQDPSPPRAAQKHTHTLTLCLHQFSSSDQVTLTHAHFPPFTVTLRDSTSRTPISVRPQPRTPQPLRPCPLHPLGPAHALLVVGQNRDGVEPRPVH